MNPVVLWRMQTGSKSLTAQTEHHLFWRRRVGSIALGLAWLLIGTWRADAQTPSTVPGTVDSTCMEALLRQLGWRIVQTQAATPHIVDGLPCQRDSLASAQAAGDLQAMLPAAWTAQQRNAQLQAMLAWPSTRCAFSFLLGAATRRAVARLESNPGYRFSAVQLGWISFGWRRAPAQGWEQFRGFGRGYQPVDSNTHALDAFYHGHVRTECGVGRQVAQLATQRELYGDAGFDAEFTPSELSIGTFLTLHRTDSILLGAHAGTFFADGKAVKTAMLGRQAFIGVPGFIAHVFDNHFLDDINNQAENFVVVDVSNAAAQALAKHGGLAYYDTQNRRIWELAQPLRGHGRQYFRRLLYERDPTLLAALSHAQQAIAATLFTLLDDPFYRGFAVYVHRQGIKPIGFHIARLLDRNPRTPFSIDLALHNVYTTLYWRWIDRQLRICKTGQTMMPLPVEPTIEHSTASSQR